MLGQAVFNESMRKTRPQTAVVKFLIIVNNFSDGIFCVDKVENCGVDVCGMFRNLLNCGISLIFLQNLSRICGLLKTQNCGNRIFDANKVFNNTLRI